MKVKLIQVAKSAGQGSIQNMRIAIVLDKSGTIIDPCRVIYDLKTKSCLFHVNTLSYVLERKAALVNLRGPLGNVIHGNLDGISFKVSCSAFSPPPDLFPESTITKEVVEGVRIAIENAISHCASELGACAAIIVSRSGEVTHAVGLGGRLYADVRDSVISMREKAVDVFLATGNCREMTLECAKCLNLPEENAIFDASPNDKMQLVRELKGSYDTVIMVGNDINDLTAMREADIAILVKRNSVNGIEMPDRSDRSEDIDYIVRSMREVEGIVSRIRSS